MENLDTPALVLTGEYTYPFFAEVGEQFVRCSPNAKAMVVSGVKHDGPIRASGIIADVILEFIDGMAQ